MTRAERVFEAVMFAYLGAVAFLVLIPVLLFMGALRVADWIDERWENYTT